MIQLRVVFLIVWIHVSSRFWNLEKAKRFHRARIVRSNAYLAQVFGVLIVMNAVRTAKTEPNAAFSPEIVSVSLGFTANFVRTNAKKVTGESIAQMCANVSTEQTVIVLMADALVLLDSKGYFANEPAIPGLMEKPAHLHVLATRQLHSHVTT